MIAGIYSLLRPLLLSIDAETAHGLTIAALRALPTRPALPTGDPMLRQKLFGLDFPNPVGLAAGFDKNAEVPDAMLGFGFGFVEIGTVTPRPQAGNPRPRLFRLPGDSGVINRFGFNSQGHEKAAARLRARAGRPGIVGVNVGANKDAADRVADYVAGIRIFADLASFFIVNVSSPNTPGLRDLQARGALDELLARVLEARDAAPVRRPVLLKIAPDLALAELDDVIDVARTRGIDGLIVSNTTISRPASLREAMIAKEAGGLSGRPLFELSTRMLAEAYRRVDGAFPLVGTGGIDSPETALAKIRAGASLVQLYSALVYEGPGLAARIVEGLAAAARASGGIPALVGQDATTLAPG